MAGHEHALTKGSSPGPEILLADAQDQGGKEKSIIPEGIKAFGRDLWGKTKEVTGDVVQKGKELKDGVADELKDVDTEKLKKQASEGAKKGIDVYQGDKSTGNKTVDTIIDFGKELNPFKKITDKAAQMGEKGLKGEKITDKDIKEAAGAAASDIILPVPEGLKDLERMKKIGDKTGLSKPVMEALEKAQAAPAGSTEEVITKAKGDDKDGTADVEIVENAKEIGSRFSRFFKKTFGGNDGDKQKK